MSKEIHPEAEPLVADEAMTVKLREILASFDKKWIRRSLKAQMPAGTVTWMDTRFIVEPEGNFTEEMLWEKGRPPEHDATEAIAERLKDRDAVIADVGANAGIFGLPVLRACGTASRGLFFEPNPVMRARLERNIVLNALKSRARVFDCAVSDAAGELALQLPPNGNLGQVRIELAYAGEKQSDFKVPVRTLPDCLKSARVKKLDFLKVDVEGLEDRVILPLLEGDKALWPELLYFEISHGGAWQEDLLERLDASGFTQDETFGHNALFRRKR